MRILITGGAGFLGSHIADRCIECGHEVAIVDNLETGSSKNVPDAAMYISADINSKEAIYFMFGFKPEVVVHAAASYKNPKAWGIHVQTNVIGSSVILELCKNFGCRLIYFQTSLCYGPPKQIPIPVTHPINPQNSYAISKTAAESYIINSGVDYVSFRLANVYGPRNLSGPIPTFYKNIVEGKKCIVKDTNRDFVYVGDLVDTVMSAVSGIGMGVFHVSTGHSSSIKSIYSALSIQLGKIGIMEEQSAGSDDVVDLVLQPNALYPKPATPMAVGLRHAIEWYKNNEIKETFTHLKVNNAS